MRLVTCLVFALALSLFVLAATGAEKSPEEIEAEVLAPNLAPWKGITFACIPDADDQVLRDVCRRVEAELKLLAASHKISLRVREAEFRTTVDQINDAYLPLHVQLRATRADSSGLKSIYARMAFSYWVNGRTQEPSDEGKRDPLAGRTISTSVDFWERDLIGHGAEGEIARAVSNPLESFAKEAIALWLKYNTAGLGS